MNLGLIVFEVRMLTGNNPYFRNLSIFLSVAVMLE